MSMSIAVAIAILTFGSGLLGLYLQKRLPRTHLTGGSKEMILAVIGLLRLLLALVLGTPGRQYLCVLRDAKVRTRNHGVAGAAGRSGARAIRP